MKILLPLALFLLVSIPSFSCDCLPIKNLYEAQKTQFQNSNLVFIGRIVSSAQKKRSYNIEIIELFKGNPKEKVVKGRSNDSCAHFPMDDEGLWLVYATYSPDGTIYISNCGLSRSFAYPINFGDETQLLPQPEPLEDAILDQLNEEILIAEYRKKSLEMLKKEIEQLRKLK